MSLRCDLGEVITAMVTPMDDTRAIDYASVEKLSKHLLEQKTDAIVVSGTTGESPTLTHEEEYEGSIFFLVGNKTDLIRDELLTDPESWAGAKSLDYMETSAKTNSNIESLFTAVATAVDARSLFYGKSEHTLVEEARPRRKCC